MVRPNWWQKTMLCPVVVIIWNQFGELLCYCGKICVIMMFFQLYQPAKALATAATKKDKHTAGPAMVLATAPARTYTPSPEINCNISKIWDGERFAE